jgi:EmrB/QacA subfamily drug resistance transporter
MGRFQMKAILLLKPPGDAANPVTETRVSARDFLRIFTAVMLPMFMAAIDQTLLAAATPAIAADLGGLRDATWIALGYLIATMITVPLYGRLGDRYGRSRMLLAALGVFAVGSVACAAAASMLELVIARVVQGLGGGGLMVMSQALIGELLPPRERPRFQGYFAANFTLASILGPILGGFVVTHFSWRWLFIVNVPLVFVAAWRVWRQPVSPPSRAAPAFEDAPGAMLFVAATVLGIVWLSFAGHRFAWISPTSAGLFAAVLICVAWLVRKERALASPLLPVELLRVPGVGAMAATTALFAACLFACIFFLPIALQLGTGSAASDTGLLLLPITLGMVVGSMLTGRIVARSGRPRVMPIAGLSLSALALAALGLTPPLPWIVALLGALCGVGFGTVMPSAQMTIQTLAGRAKLGAASAVVSLARSTGAVLGTALFGALVFSLLHGVDLDVALHAGTEAQRANILHAFQRGFLASALLAALGAWAAARVPKLTL